MTRSSARTSAAARPHRTPRSGPGTPLVVREPAGVVAAITPFNYPFFLNIQKIGPALAAGCTVVLKPTEYICRDAYEIARIADEETDLPPGVLNVLLGGAGDVGEGAEQPPACRPDHVHGQHPGRAAESWRTPRRP